MAVRIKRIPVIRANSFFFSLIVTAVAGVFDSLSYSKKSFPKPKTRLPQENQRARSLDRRWKNVITCLRKKTSKICHSISNSENSFHFFIAIKQLCLNLLRVFWLINCKLKRLSIWKFRQKRSQQTHVEWSHTEKTRASEDTFWLAIIVKLLLMQDSSSSLKPRHWEMFW